MTSQDHLAQALAGASVAVVRPGDTLLVGYSSRLTLAEMHAHLNDLRAQLPSDVKVAITDDVAAFAVIRPDGDA